MKKFYRNTIVIAVFISLFIGGGAFCAEISTALDEEQNNQGIDVKELKNVGSFFKFRKNKKHQEVKDSSSVENMNLENASSKTFDDTDNDKEVSKTNKKKFNFNFFKKKKNNQQEPMLDENIESEEIQTDSMNQDAIYQDEANNIEEGTYINDTDVVYIQEVEIFGNNLLDVNYIKNQITSKEGKQYIRSDVSNDLRALYNTGYFTQNIRALPIKIDDNNVKLRIILEENPPIEGFAVIGNNSISTKEIMNILNKYKGQPQNILSINDAIAEIQELYSTRGYILSAVTRVSDDPDGYIYFLIDEGVIGDIIVEGNNKTRDFIVKRNIFLQPGSVYNENTMRSDILRLMGTQAFKDVQRELKKDENTGLYDVYIALEEQRTGRISLGVGVDSASGFFGSVGFGENNFRGLGQKLNLNLLAGTGILMNDSSVVEKANYQGELSFLEPMFKRENQSLAIRAFARYYGSYQVPLAIEKRFGAEATVSRRFTTYRNLTGSLSFGLENVSLSEGDLASAKARYKSKNIPFSRRAEELDDGLYLRVTPALVYDTRDSSVNPRRGVLARVTLEENLGITGNTFGKLHGMMRRFVPVGKKSSIVLTAKAGGKLHGDMPDFASYALGGPYSIRGFNISEVGVGDGYMMGSAEYRLPIPFIDRLTSNSFLNNLRLAAFVDAGTLFNKTVGTELYGKPGYAISAGIGLRIFIPGLGPINLDYGMPITNTAGIDRSKGFFTFGMGEMF